MREVLKRIEKTRMQKKISQERISESLQLSQAAYAKIERGETKLTLDRLFQIAEILKVKVSELLGIEVIMTATTHVEDKATITASQSIENLYFENRDIKDKLLQHLESSLADKNKIIQALEHRIQELS